MYHKNLHTPDDIEHSGFADGMGLVICGYHDPLYDKAINCDHCAYCERNTNPKVCNPTSRLCLFWKDLFLFCYWNKDHPDLDYDFTRGFETMSSYRCNHFQANVQHSSPIRRKKL